MLEILASTAVVAAGLWLTWAVLRALASRSAFPERLRQERLREAERIFDLVCGEYRAVSTSPCRAGEVPELCSPEHPCTTAFLGALAAVEQLHPDRRRERDAYIAAVGRLAATWQHLQDQEAARWSGGPRGHARAELLVFRMDVGEPALRRQLRSGEC